MGNQLKRCFGPAPEPASAEKKSGQKHQSLPDSSSGETKPNHSDGGDNQEKLDDKINTTKQPENAKSEAPTSDQQQQQQQQQQQPHQTELLPVKKKPKNVPNFSGVSTQHLAAPSAENPKNKYSYEVDAQFFRKSTPARKPMNRNLEWYEAKNIKGLSADDTNNNNNVVHFIRGPDDIQDQRVCIEKCSNGAKFVIADECDSIQIDECQDCSFFIGPTAGSVFARNCTNCSFVAVCSQLRLRDCKQCYIELFTPTKPVIESSSEIGFSRWVGPEYSDLRRQMAKAKLSVLNNKWWQIHDFTPNTSSSSSHNHVIFHDVENNNNVHQEEEEARAVLKSKQEFIARCCPLAPVIDSLVFSSAIEENGLERANIGTTSKEEELVLRNEPQTIPRVWSTKKSSTPPTTAAATSSSSSSFILFQPGSFNTAINFCLKHSAASSSSCCFVKYAVETKFKDEKMLAGFFEGLVERLQQQGDEGKAKLKQIGQLLLGNVACCVVVEHRNNENSGLDFTDEEISNIAVYLDGSGDDHKIVKMLTHTVFLSQQATGGSGFGHAF